MSYLLSILDPGEKHQKTYSVPLVKDIREYVEIVRRLTIAHYEEARLYWTKALNDDFFADNNEINMYTISELKKLIVKYTK